MEKKTQTLEERYDHLEKVAETLQNKIRNIDFHFIDQTTKRYGFDKEKVYYIGVGSGQIYKKPIRADIVGMIENYRNLKYNEIAELNRYFMNK